MDNGWNGPQQVKEGWKGPQQAADLNEKLALNVGQTPFVACNPQAQQARPYYAPPAPPPEPGAPFLRELEQKLDLLGQRLNAISSDAEGVVARAFGPYPKAGENNPEPISIGIVDEIKSRFRQVNSRLDDLEETIRRLRELA